VGLAVLGLRTAGLLESLELAAYDAGIRLRPIDRTPDQRVLLVTATERDIQQFGSWPLPDGVLARALATLLRGSPRAIGLDIYRDVPVPPGTDALRAVLTGDPRIIAVMKFAEGGSTGVRPPAALDGSDQVGFNDVIVDPGGIVRRGLLFLDDGATVFSSFALRLALLYLQPHGIAPQPDPSDPRYLRLGATTIRPLEPNDGSYVRADTRGYQFLLDFKGDAASFASVDLSSVLAGSFDPAVVKDKVVLLGVTAESIKDNFYTPYSRGRQEGQDTPGIAIHAQIVGQLLRAGLDGAVPTRTLAEWAEAVVIFVAGGLGTLLGLRLRSPWWVTLAAAGGVVTMGIGAFALFLAGWWVPLVPPALAWMGSAEIVIAYVSYQEMRQRADLMQLFSRHVSREVAEAIWDQRQEFLDGGRPRSQRLMVTALFTDLTGFTTVSEKHSPEVLMEWLNEYMDVMARQVSRFGGVIRQYAGDSIVVIFGVPVARPSEAEVAADAVSAVECALAMADALRELNRRWRAEGRPLTGMRVGIFTGTAVAGSLGSAERSEYVVVGDTVNTASRLESFDKELFPPDPDVNPSRILVGEPTLHLLGSRFEVERVGDAYVKGKEHTVAIYRVLGRAHEGAETDDGEGLAQEEPR